MPTYFVHITEGDELIPDPEGIKCANLSAIQEEAIRSARALINEAVEKGKRDYKGRLDVEDENGAKLLTVTFSCVVQLEIVPPSVAGDASPGRSPDEDRPG